jgi:hypothetical protein
MTDPRTGKSKKPSPLQPAPISPTDMPVTPTEKPAAYEKEWDDTETRAGDALDRRDQKKKEDI